MATFKVAHIRQQNIDLIIVLMDASFGQLSSADQNDTIEYLQICATNADLAGTVVPVWYQGGRVHFIAPPNWHPFFKSLSWQDILRNVNTELTCS